MPLELHALYAWGYCYGTRWTGSCWWLHPVGPAELLPELTTGCHECWPQSSEKALGIPIHIHNMILKWSTVQL